MNLKRTLFSLLGSVFLVTVANAQSTKPVFFSGYREVTAHKPQSKLWYAHGRWWALLPWRGDWYEPKIEGGSGLRLWERTESGWKDHPEVELVGSKGIRLTGWCDVWPETEDEVTVVISPPGSRAIHVFRLNYAEGSWKETYLASLPMPDTPGKAGIMAATIARDGKGEWWVAADMGGSVFAWHSKDALAWSSAILLAENIQQGEDMCLITPIPSGVGVIWSDQNKDRVVIREHLDGTPENQWKPETIIEEGNKTADNHLKAALSSDGTLWVATKNSVDEKDKPQLVLRVRSPQGEWKNYPYAPRRENGVLEPSRPAIYATPDPKVMLLGHNIVDYRTWHGKEGGPHFIEFGLADPSIPGILKNVQPVMIQDREMNGNGLLRNITGPKFPFPEDAPWIVLSSDEKGNIYEADLKTLIQNK